MTPLLYLEMVDIGYIKMDTISNSCLLCMAFGGRDHKGVFVIGLDIVAMVMVFFVCQCLFARVVEVTIMINKILKNKVSVFVGCDIFGYQCCFYRDSPCPTTWIVKVLTMTSTAAEDESCRDMFFEMGVFVICPVSSFVESIT